MVIFGSGRAIVTQNNVTNPTPYDIGFVQKISFNDKAKNVPLHAQYRRAIVSTGGTITTEVKITAARYVLGALASAFLGAVPSAGGTLPVRDFAATIPTTPFQVTIIPPSSGVFAADQGVTYAATGLRLTRGATASAAGVYAVNTSTGVYTFNTADAGLGVLISYDYTVATGPETITASNTLLGTQPTVKLAIDTISPKSGKPGLIVANYVSFAGLDLLGTDVEKYSMADLTGEAFADDAGVAWKFTAYPQL